MDMVQCAEQTSPLRRRDPRSRWRRPADGGLNRPGRSRALIARNARWTLCVLLAALPTTLLATGCGSPDGGIEPPATEPAATASKPAGRSSDPATPTTPDKPATTRRPTTSTPTPASSATATDGKNYEACEDGTCQVAISGPVTFPLTWSAGQGTFTFREVISGGVNFDFAMPGRPTLGGSVTKANNCALISPSNGGGGLLCTPRELPAPGPGEIVMRVLDVVDGTVTLQLVAG